MMLHEAVMLEIYRQALHASEMASPRCQSRDSSGGGRCPSDESITSGRGGDRDGSGNNLSPVAITLPPTLPPGAAAALLPQHSAAMAAYLNAAAVAAQQNRLLLGSPLAQLAAVTQQQRNGSPPLLPPLGSPNDDGDDGVLDFSKKRTTSNSDNDNDDDDNDDNDNDDNNSDCDAVNLSHKTENSPLDLSVTSSRKRVGEELLAHHHSRKMSRALDYKQIVSPWTSPQQLPYFAAAVAAAQMSPKNNHNDWNGKHKSAQNDATKALEKMSELSRLGGEDLYRSGSNNQPAAVGGGRHSAWQSHWLNKGADSAKDVLKCVWCKQSFPSLAAMTTHMKETKHCGVNVPPGTGMQQPPPQQPPSSTNTNNNREANKASQNELNMLIKETMPLPRKLVRGQDVWLGKGAEQTRQILKCMWCGQSFRTLAEMTSHMQQTQHYTNIISQEQIISWKSTDGEKPGSGPGGPGASGGGPGGPQSGGGPNAQQPNSHVSAVLTCKVCDQAFSSLKELSNHMVKNAHYKEHIMRSITESGGRRRQTREKRKKSLPVRKLLELERASHDFKNGEVSPMANKPIRDFVSSKITCEKCNEKIETATFVDHIRQCIGATAMLQAVQQRDKLKNALLSNTIIPPDSVSPVTPNSRDGRKSVGDDLSSPLSLQKSPMPSDLSSPASGKKDSGDKSSSPSVLNAIEQLIEKSFDTRSRHANSSFGNANQTATPLGSSILKRLGIDESVDYTKPLVDTQTMNLLRNYHQQHYASQFGRRERSGSESSSISERGSSRVDSLTPEKKFDTPSHSTPRGTPDKHFDDDDEPVSMKIKREMHSDDEHENDEKSVEPPKIKIKREIDEDEEEGQMRPPSKSSANDDKEVAMKRRNSIASSPAPSPRMATSSVPLSPAASPISDHHSVASRSTPGANETTNETGRISVKKSLTASSGGSLGALSSMFDSLTGANNATSSNDGQKAKGNAHPLAALQKLCDKTETTSSNNKLSSTLLTPTTNLASRTAPGAILAFSWACNDAQSTDDSTIKCAYCDTSFSSKGAYRHHLSKAHFVNDDTIPDPKSSTSSSSNNNKPPPSPHSPKSTSSREGANSANQTKSPPPSQSPASFDESPHSKFLKYTELAKQLSSKYV